MNQTTDSDNGSAGKRGDGDERRPVQKGPNPSASNLGNSAPSPKAPAPADDVEMEQASKKATGVTQDQRPPLKKPLR